MSESPKDHEAARIAINQAHKQSTAIDDDSEGHLRIPKVDQHDEALLFKVVSSAWPVSWVVLALSILTLQQFAIVLSAVFLIATAAAILANIWGGILLWRRSGRCPAWLPFELFLFVATPLAVFMAASVLIRKVGWAGP